MGHFFVIATGRKKRVKGASALKELEAKRASKRARNDSVEAKVVEKKDDVKVEEKNEESETAMDTETAEGNVRTLSIFIW